MKNNRVLLCVGLLAFAAWPACGAEASRPHVVLVSYENEYHSAESLPPFARQLHDRYGYECTCLQGENGKGIPGLEQLATADVLVLYVRRQALPKDQMAMIRRYLDAGKPLVALRTACHAFDILHVLNQQPPPGWQVWTDFDHEVIGGNYHDHYTEGPRTQVLPADHAAGDPILAGVRLDGWISGACLYKTSPLAPTARLLLSGRCEGHVEPLAWTNTYHGDRVFYTSLGDVEDFHSPQFQTLLINAVRWAMQKPVPKGPQ